MGDWKMVGKTLMPTITAQICQINSLNRTPQIVPLISAVSGLFFFGSVVCGLRHDCLSFFTALFHLVWSQGQDVHDDVQAVAECAAGQGKQI